PDLIGQEFFPVFGGPHKMEPDLYMWHGLNSAKAGFFYLTFYLPLKWEAIDGSKCPSVIGQSFRLLMRQVFGVDAFKALAFYPEADAEARVAAVTVVSQGDLVKARFERHKRGLDRIGGGAGKIDQLFAVDGQGTVPG